MKKIFSLAILSLFYVTGLQAAGINVGVSLSGSVFELDGASEDFKAGHVSNVDGSAAVSKKASSEGENAEGAFVLGSVFLEKEINDRFTIGLDYVPMSMESETTENVQNTGAYPGSNVTNTVQVDFEDMTTIYALMAVNENVYLKVGMMSVDVKTNENLGTGGAYDDTSLDGKMIGIGYDRDLNNGSFLRIEANYMDLDGVTLVNSNDSNKSVKADGISGYGARVSIGKSF